MTTDAVKDLLDESGEYKALCTIAIRDLQKAQMMMVKAIHYMEGLSTVIPSRLPMCRRRYETRI